MGSIVSLPGQRICKCLIKFLISINSCDYVCQVCVYIYTHTHIQSSMLGILVLSLSAYQFVSMHKYLKINNNN